MKAHGNESPEESETRRTWEKVAGLYVELFLDPALYRAGYDVLLQVLPPGARVLDAACGPGIIAHYLLQHRPDLQVTGVDYAEPMLVQARALVPAARFEAGDLRELPAPTAPWHAIVCGFGLPYLNEDAVRRFFAYCRTQLEAEGRLYFSYVFDPDGKTGYRTGSTGDRVWFHNHAPATIHAALSAEGFAIEYQWTVDSGKGSERYEILMCKDISFHTL